MYSSFYAIDQQQEKNVSNSVCMEREQKRSVSRQKKRKIIEDCSNVTAGKDLLESAGL